MNNLLPPLRGAQCTGASVSMGKKSKAVDKAAWAVLCLSVIGWAYAGMQIIEGDRAEQAALKQWDMRHHAAPQAALPAAGLPEERREEASAVRAGVGKSAAEPAPSAPQTAVQEKAAVWGVIYIPKADKRIPLFAGTEADVLKKGAGFDPNGAFPGQPGNSVISGHRDTVFRVLSQTKPGDDIQVETEAGVFTYTVESTEIIKETGTYSFPEEEASVLRLITCYPFYYAGPAPERFIATARLRTQN
ncbi:hypothetical protein DQG13_18600 [Paenibacillus sp. YN15]|nr:hypothetical protein DQG13_18600 [Paenibacillus sp. YN15]